jgi:hypothetical protein
LTPDLVGSERSLPCEKCCPIIRLAGDASTD